VIDRPVKEPKQATWRVVGAGWILARGASAGWGIPPDGGSFGERYALPFPRGPCSREWLCNAGGWTTSIRRAAGTPRWP